MILQDTDRALFALSAQSAIWELKIILGFMKWDWVISDFLEILFFAV